MEKVRDAGCAYAGPAVMMTEGHNGPGLAHGGVLRVALSPRRLDVSLFRLCARRGGNRLYAHSDNGEQKQ